MSRSLKDFTPGERNAYVVWNQKLADRTLPKEEHDRARSELDKLFRRGPFAELHLLKDELQEIKARLAILEDYVLASPGPNVPAPADVKVNVTGRIATPDGSYITVDALNTPLISPAPKVIRADVDQSMGIKQKTSANPCEDVDVSNVAGAEDPSPETRGRPKFRYHPEKDANKQWHVLDRETGEYTGHGPYKTRREAKEMADTLNNMPTPFKTDSVDARAPADEGQKELPLKWDPEMGDPVTVQLPLKWDPEMGDPADNDIGEEDPFADLGF